MKILSAFFRDWRSTGAVAATSRFTQRKALDPVDWRRARVVVELGPGCGSVTRAILGRLHRDARFVALEINEQFVSHLRRDFADPRLTVVHGSACDLPRVLDDCDLPPADAIVSTLPFSTLEPDLRDAIVRAMASSLSREGRVLAIQYQPFALPPLLQSHFERVDMRMSWLNVPPAFIYTCTRALSSVQPTSAEA